MDISGVLSKTQEARGQILLLPGSRVPICGLHSFNQITLLGALIQSWNGQRVALEARRECSVVVIRSETRSPGHSHCDFGCIFGCLASLNSCLFCSLWVPNTSVVSRGYLLVFQYVSFLATQPSWLLLFASDDSGPRPLLLPLTLVSRQWSTLYTLF